MLRQGWTWADGAVDRLLQLRLEARKSKDFAKSDGIRNLLTEAGVQIEDTPQGARRWGSRCLFSPAGDGLEAG